MSHAYEVTDKRMDLINILRGKRTHLSSLAMLEVEGKCYAGCKNIFDSKMH